MNKLNEFDLRLNNNWYVCVSVYCVFHIHNSPSSYSIKYRLFIRYLPMLHRIGSNRCIHSCASVLLWMLIFWMVAENPYRCCVLFLSSFRSHIFDWCNFAVVSSNVDRCVHFGYRFRNSNFRAAQIQKVFNIFNQYLCIITRCMHVPFTWFGQFKYFLILSDWLEHLHTNNNYNNGIDRQLAIDLT